MFIPADGPYYDFFSTGQLMIEGYMRNNACEYHIEYTKYGTKTKEYIYNDDGSYLLKSYYPNGSIHDEYNYDADDNLTGRFKTYRITGVIEHEGYYHKGLKYGIWKMYDSTGKLISEQTYRRNDLHGLSREIMMDHKMRILKYYYGYYEKVPLLKRIVGLFYSLKDKKFDYC